jgi:hypothetical protein
MGDKYDNERLVLWGLVTAMVLLIVSLILNSLILFELLEDGGLTADQMEAIGVGTAALALMAVIGALAVYVKHISKADDD